jgi:tartrate dehydrogenase/decarboxylase/D-malate dehydrogenase
MMLDHLGEREAAVSIVAAIERVLADRSAPRTADLGGRARTSEVAEAIAGAL